MKLILSTITHNNITIMMNLIGEEWVASTLRFDHFIKATNMASTWTLEKDIENRWKSVFRCLLWINAE